MKSIFLSLVFLFVSSICQAKLICTGDNVTYVEDLKSFGFPRIPLGTLLGTKTLILNGQIKAHKEIIVTDPNNWTNYHDWNYKLDIKKEVVQWVSPDNIYEVQYSAHISVSDEKENKIIDNESVTCLSREVLMP